MANVPMIKLNNGLSIPAIGFGTYKLNGNEGLRAIKDALDIGYRHLDTAFLYKNEKEVGEAVQSKIAEGGVTREDFFIVTKVWSSYFQKVEESCHQSLKKLGVSYIDLLLMHFPVGYVYKDDDTIWPENDEDIDNIDYLKVYGEMEKLVEKGLVKSIGVSNFNTVQIERLLKNCKIKPVLNEIESHPGLTPSKLIEFCQERDIAISAYCPLGRYDAEKKEPKYFFDPKVQEMAKKYKKTPFQIVIRYSFELGTIPIPKSATKSRIADNFEIFDFELTKDEVAYLKSFSHPDNRVAKFLQVKNAEHYPFNVEF